jgi:hypothetical protein
MCGWSVAVIDCTCAGSSPDACVDQAIINLQHPTFTGYALSVHELIRWFCLQGSLQTLWDGQAATGIDRSA